MSLLAGAAWSVSRAVLDWVPGTRRLAAATLSPGEPNLRAQLPQEELVGLVVDDRGDDASSSSSAARGDAGNNNAAAAELPDWVQARAEDMGGGLPQARFRARRMYQFGTGGWHAILDGDRPLLDESPRGGLVAAPDPATPPRLNHLSSPGGGGGDDQPPVVASSAAAAAHGLRILTYNVMMDNFNKFVSGVIHTTTRYRAILALLEQQEATRPFDVLCLQEVDAEFLHMLAESRFIQDNFVLSDVMPDDLAARDDEDADDEGGPGVDAQEQLGPGHSIRPHGVAILVRSRRDLQKDDDAASSSLSSSPILRVLSAHALLCDVPATRNRVVVNVPARPSLCVRLQVDVGASSSSSSSSPPLVLAVVASHFEAYNNRYAQRSLQLGGVYRSLRLGPSATDDSTGRPLTFEHFQFGDDNHEEVRALTADQALIVGDFNFHQEAEGVSIVSPFVDVWRQLHGSHQGASVVGGSGCDSGSSGRSADQTDSDDIVAARRLGYSWDSKKNGLINAMWLGVDARRMRLDRVLLSSPTAHDARGDSDEHERLLSARSIQFFGTTRVGDILPDVPAGASDLHPSDHFGLDTVLSVNEKSASL